MSSTSWLVFVILFGTFASTRGWGIVGHSMVVRLAQSQMTNAASEWVRGLTPWFMNGNLSAMASWADDIIYANTNPTGYVNWEWSKVLHYADTPDWSCEYQYQRDCVDDVCVHGAIKNYTKRLETELDETQQKDALYFLIHFVGDIHQPLHTGFTSDRGGNSVRGHFMNESSTTNLHSLWDSGMITHRLKHDFQSNTSLYYDHLREIMNGEPSIANDDVIEQWIKENVDYVCSQVYLDENEQRMNASLTFTLGEKYYQKNLNVVERRLALGGRRLGALLNLLATKRPQKPSDPKSKLSGSSIALIVLICVEVVIAIVVGGVLWTRRQKGSASTSSLSFSPRKP